MLRRNGEGQQYCHRYEYSVWQGVRHRCAGLDVFSGNIRASERAGKESEDSSSKVFHTGGPQAIMDVAGGAKARVWGEKQTARARFQEKWSGALAALRNDRMTRSDDESKWDPRLLQYFRCYDNKGELVTGLSLPVSLVVVISTDGYVEVNYKDPKDPRKKGVWSDTIIHRPLRVQAVLTAKFGHLTNSEAVEAVCAIRLFRSLVLVRHDRNWDAR